MNLPGIPGSDELPAPRRRVRLWITFIVALALAILLALLVLGLIAGATGSQMHHGANRAGQIAGAIVCTVLLILAGRWAIALEHRLRRHQPVAQAFEARHTSGTAPARAARTRGGRGHHGRYGPFGTTVVVLLTFGATIGLAVGAVVVHSQSVRSGYVQAHGVARTATVDNVDNSSSCGRYGCSYSAAIEVTLAQPVNGSRTTTIHYPDTSDLFDGDSVSVLVDPHQTDYAELPGTKFESSGSWVILAVFAVFLALVSALEIAGLWRLLTHRREHLASQAAASSAVGR